MAGGTWGATWGASWGGTWGYSADVEVPVEPDPTDPTDVIHNPGAQLPPPDNDLICDRTGFQVTITDGLHREWTGYLVRKESLDHRHPQELVRARPEPTNPSPRPEQEDVFIADRFPTGVTIDDLDG